VVKLEGDNRKYIRQGQLKGKHIKWKNEGITDGVENIKILMDVRKIEKVSSSFGRPFCPSARKISNA
jgi:hypothetical protein